MGEFAFRRVAERDFPALTDIAIKSFTATYAGLLDPAQIKALIDESYPPSVLARFLERATKGEIFFEVATVADRPVAFCLISTGRVPAPRRLHHRFSRRLDGTLHRLYAYPEYGGKGTGYGLLARGEAFMRARGVVRYSCFVHRENEIGKRFYLRQGFRHVASKDSAEDWYMEKSLAGHVVMACALLLRAVIG